MPIRHIALAALVLSPLLSGCVARAVTSVVTAPVRIAGKGVDMMTTSQSEADEKRGRNLRHQEEKLGKLQRQYERHNRDCLRGDEEACDQARRDYGEMQDLRGSLPPQPR
jgi:hypothetical protein